MDTVNSVVKVFGLLIAITLNGCNDNSTPCSEKFYSLSIGQLPYVEVISNIDSIYFKRDRFGKSDTILFTREDFVEDILIYDNCPRTMDKYERVSLRLVSENDQKIVIELFNYKGITIFCTFIHDEVLATSLADQNHTIDLETGTYRNCVFKRDIINKNYRTGYSEKVFTDDGLIDFKYNSTDNNSTAYFNLDNGLVNINLYLDTDSLLTYQRIL